MQKITFGEYLKSRDQLLEAVDKPSHSIVEYVVRKYCKLDMEGSTYDLKPKQTITVEWVAINENAYIPCYIVLSGNTVRNHDQSNISCGKLNKWLSRNADKGNVL